MGQCLNRVLAISTGLYIGVSYLQLEECKKGMTLGSLTYVKQIESYTVGVVLNIIIQGRLREPTPFPPG